MRWRTLRRTGLAVTAYAVVGAVAVDPESDWYRSLSTPSWQPPPPAYGLVWTPLYADLAVTSAVVLDRLRAEGRVAERRAYQRSLGLNLVLNSGWSWLFFRWRRPWAAAAENAALTVSSVDLAARAARVDPRAGAALVPYAAWCGFATALTVAIARRNPR